MAFQIFSDREKWKSSWFRQLDPHYKLVWVYINDNCDQAGMWDKDLALMAFMFGDEQLNEDSILNAFGDKIIVHSDTQWFIRDFCKFQYKEITEAKKYNTVTRLLKEYGYFSEVSETSQGSPSKDKISKDKIRLLNSKYHASFEEYYYKYPRKQGDKSKGFNKLSETIKTDEDMELFGKCFTNYLAKLKAEKTEAQFIKMWSTFCNQWRDWQDWHPTESYEEKHYSMVNDPNVVFD